MGGGGGVCCTGGDQCGAGERVWRLLRYRRGGDKENGNFCDIFLVLGG